MRHSSSRIFTRVLCGSAIALVSSFALRVNAATFIWNNTTGNWSDATKWLGAAVPTGADASDVLVFAGEVGTLLAPTNYTATNDLAADPFVLNAITLNATDAANLPTDPAHVLAGTNPLRFAGVAPNITQNGAGPVTFDAPLQLGDSVLFAGNGAGVVTFNKAVSGFATIRKTGVGTFRFGTLPVLPATNAPSENSWVGPLALDDGTIRFNNNADSGRTALRANAIIFPPSGVVSPLLTCTNELRTGTLSGGLGKVESAVTGTNTSTEDIVVTALSDGAFGGTVRLGPATGTGSNLGKFVVRGPGVQTLRGTLQIDKDVEIGGTLAIGGTASLGAQTRGAIVLGGGTLRLDNTTTNNTNRLRDATATSTGLDAVGGGTFLLIGNAAATTTETVGRLQLGAQTGSAAPFRTKARAGETHLALVHRSATSFATALTLQAYERDDSSEPPLGTVVFSAGDEFGFPMTLGLAGNNPRIAFTTLPALSNGLLDNSTLSGGTGWAVVHTTTGLAFATQTSPATGITAVTTTATWASSASANAFITASQSIGASTFTLNSLRIRPTVGGQSVTIAATGSLVVKGLILAGLNDFSITGAGTLGGTKPRYLFVDPALTLTVGVGVGNTAPLVKGGPGTLVLTNNANTASTQIFAINQGVVRSPLTALPAGELRFRGGVLEITGGGTFGRPLLDGTGISGPGTVNWGTVELSGTPAAPNKTDADRGSGGFAAFGADVTIDLGAAGASLIAWEDHGFVQSGHALVLGSGSATAKVTLLDNLNLTSGDAIINYNAREIRVDDNPSSTADRAVISGIISGTLHNDLLKTGTGTLELSGANTFAGTVFAQAGRLIVSGSTAGIGIDVLSGATLGGAGSVTQILLENGARLAPGDGTLATLTGTGFTWRAGGVCNFDLNAAGASDKLALGTGALVKGSASGAFAFDFANSGANGRVYVLATFGSTTFSASDFTATNLAAGVTGTFQIIAGQLRFSTLQTPPLEVWRQQYFGAAATNSGPAADTADPDFDGLANLAEYVLLGHPLQPATNIRPLAGRTGNAPTFRFTRNTGATDVTLRIEASNTLSAGSWTPIATLPAGGAWSSTAGVTVSDNAGVVVITDSTDLTLIPKRFFHLVVTHP